MTGYRQVLALPGMAPLLAGSLLARTAITAAGMALTLYAVLGLGLGYAAAGGVAAASTAGLALGGPLLGRLIDRRGPRTALLGAVAAQAACWLTLPLLPYPALVAAAFAAGLLMVPAQSVTRQAIAAMTTAGQRRPAYALESVQGELSYMIGPALVILAAATLPAGAMARAVGLAIVLGGTVLAVLDPPLRAATEPVTVRPGRREWLGRRMIAALVLAFGVAMLLGGIDLAIVATLRAAGRVSWAAAVVAVCGLASVTGGLVHGALRRSLAGSPLLALLGLATVLAGLASGLPWLFLAVIGTGLLTAPTLAAVTDAVSRLAPAGVRGEATGLQTSAMSAGLALGSPLVGWAVDASVPAGGFVAAGLTGIAAALTASVLSRRAPAAPAPGPPVPPGASRRTPGPSGTAGSASGTASGATGTAGDTAATASGVAGTASGVAGTASGVAGTGAGVAGTVGGTASGRAGEAGGPAGTAGGPAGTARGAAGTAGGTTGGLAGTAGRPAGMAGGRERCGADA